MKNPPKSDAKIGVRIPKQTRDVLDAYATLCGTTFSQLVRQELNKLANKVKEDVQ